MNKDLTIDVDDIVLLVEPRHKTITYNIALLKFARYCKDNNVKFQYIRGVIRPDIVPTKIFMSCIFSCYTSTYDKTIDFYQRLFPSARFIVGGVFPTMSPGYFDKHKSFFYDIETYSGVCSLIDNVVPLYNCDIKDEEVPLRFGGRLEKLKNKKNLFAYYTSRGCNNKCKYCAVPMVEGKISCKKSMSDAIRFAKMELGYNCKKLILLDNNFVANPEYNNIITEIVDANLKVDIVSGFEMKLFTDEVAKNISRLTFTSQGNAPGTVPYIRFAYDRKADKKWLDRTILLIKKYNIKAYPFLYMLYNFNDTPEEIYERIQYCYEITLKYKQSIFIFPQRYIPYDSLKVNEYVSPNWTEDQVRGFRYLTTVDTHGFVGITTSGRIFDYIGKTQEEFIYKIENYFTLKK